MFDFQLNMELKGCADLLYFFVNLKTISLATLIFVLLILIRERFQTKEYPPGPISLPIVGVLPHVGLQMVLFRKDLREIWTDWARKYGPVCSFKMGFIRIVLLSDYESMKIGFSGHDLAHRISLKFITPKLGKGIVHSSGRVWQEQRRFTLNLFRKFGIGKALYEDQILTESSYFLDALSAVSGKVINPEPYIVKAVSNIIFFVTVGHRYEYEDGEIHDMLDRFLRSVELPPILVGMVYFLPFLARYPIGPLKELTKNVKTFINYGRKEEKSHWNTYDSNNPRDITDEYYIEMEKVQNTDKADIFTPRNLTALIGDLASAGIETTSTSLRWILCYLLNNPRIQKQAQADIDRVVGRNRLPRYDDQKQLPYIEGIIAEGLRLGTVNTPFVPHLCARDTTLNGFVIPKGSVIIPNLHAVSNDPSVWTDPPEFRPERHISAEGTFHSPEEFTPFGVGRRSCIGEKLAKMELFIFLSHLLHRFTVSLPEGEKPPSTRGHAGFTYKAVPFNICVTERDK